MISTGLPSHFQGRFQEVIFGLPDEDESTVSKSNPMERGGAR